MGGSLNSGGDKGFGFPHFPHHGGNLRLRFRVIFFAQFRPRPVLRGVSRAATGAFADNAGAIRYAFSYAIRAQSLRAIMFEISHPKGANSEKSNYGPINTTNPPKNHRKIVNNLSFHLLHIRR